MGLAVVRMSIKYTDRPSVKQTLYLLHPHTVLVFPLHIVDVVSHSSHCIASRQDHVVPEDMEDISTRCSAQRS